MGPLGSDLPASYQCHDRDRGRDIFYQSRHRPCSDSRRCPTERRAGRDRFRGQYNYNAVGPQSVSGIGGPLRSVFRSQDRRSWVGRGVDADLCQRRTAGSVSESLELWSSGIWSTGGCPHLFWKVRRGIEPGRGHTTGGHTPVSCALRSV